MTPWPYTSVLCLPTGGYRQGKDSPLAEPITLIPQCKTLLVLHRFAVSVFCHFCKLGLRWVRRYS